MKPLMPPVGLIPRPILSSARSGSQSRIAEELCREARRVYDADPLFQDIESATHKAMQRGNSTYQPRNVHELQKWINQNRDKVLDLARLEKQRRKKTNIIDFWDSFSPLPPSVKAKFNLMETEQVGNCAEINSKLQYLLDGIGIPTLIIKSKIQQEVIDRYCSNHAFLVAGLSPHADLTKPSTYGEESVYLDAWFPEGLFLPVQEGIKKLEDLFNLRVGESFDFEPYDFHCHSGKNFTRENSKPPAFATVEHLPPRFRNL